MPRLRHLTTAICACATFLALAGTTAEAEISVGGGGGGATVAGAKAKLKANGKAIPPEEAPARVKRAIRAANAIEDLPYKLGGGHKSWKKDNGYDCSGAVSWTLGPKGARVLDSPIPSGSFKSWGKKGKGNWITVYADGGHAFVVIAGLRFDTSMPDDGKSGPGWSKDVKAGFANVSKNRARTHKKV